MKRRDILDVEVVFVDRSAIVPTPAGTTLQTALKRSFSDPQFLAAAANDGTLNLYTVPVEELFPGNTASASALLEVKYTRPGEETRTATLAVELQNSVILGTEGTPVAVPDLKATLADAEAGTDNTKWMTPLRVWDAIRKAATAAVTWATLPGKPSTFPPEAHTHTAAQITDLSIPPAATWDTLPGKPSAFPPSTHQHAVADVTGLQTALDAKQPAGNYATAEQGAKADSALQPSALTPYRPATAQDAIDASKASATHTHTASQITDFAAAVAAVAPGGVPAGALIISKTYAELKALKDANQLVPGQWYKITDFQSMWWNQSVNHKVMMTSQVIEPLNILAITASQFASTAYSDLYPSDIVFFDFFKSRPATGYVNADVAYNKGFINRRTDMQTGIDMPFDWRHITINCCRPDLSSINEWDADIEYSLYNVVKKNNKLYYSFTNKNLNNEPSKGNPWAIISQYNEGLTYFPTDENYGFRAYKPDGSYLVNLPPLTSSRTQKPTFCLFPEQPETYNNIEYASNIKMEDGCFNNIFFSYVSESKFGKKCQFNIFGENFRNNNIGEDFSYNVVGSNFFNNNIGNNSRNNIIGFYFSGNSVLSNLSFNLFYAYTQSNSFDNDITYNLSIYGFLFNKIGSSFSGNKIGVLFVGWTTAGNFKNNIISDYSSNNITFGEFEGNNLKGSFTNNIIGGVFKQNTAQYFDSNIIGSWFYQNNITDNFRSNEIMDHFTNNQLKTFENNLIHSNFSSNTTGFNFKNNIISSYFSNNIVGDFFRKNTISANTIQNIALSTASHVYNDYDCTIFKNSSGQPRLSYYNAADQLVVTSPTA